MESVVLAKFLLVFTFIRRSVGEAMAEVVPFWYDSLREEQLGYGRNYDEASERHQHGHCPEGEVLLAALLVIERVMDDSRNPDIWLSSKQTHEEAHTETHEGPVRVDILPEVNDQQQLRKQDHVHQVTTQLAGNR